MTYYNDTDRMMKDKARRQLLEVLENGYGGDNDDLHYKIFNVKPYTSDHNEAMEALEKYGVFKAIKKVQEYEKSTYDLVYTDCSNPVRIINMLYFVIGKEVLKELIEERKDKQ